MKYTDSAVFMTSYSVNSHLELIIAVFYNGYTSVSAMLEFMQSKHGLFGGAR